MTAADDFHIYLITSRSEWGMAGAVHDVRWHYREPRGQDLAFWHLVKGDHTPRRAVIDRVGDAEQSPGGHVETRRYVIADEETGHILDRFKITEQVPLTTGRANVHGEGATALPAPPDSKEQQQ